MLIALRDGWQTGTNDIGIPPGQTSYRSLSSRLAHGEGLPVAAGLC